MATTSLSRSCSSISTEDKRYESRKYPSVMENKNIIRFCCSGISCMSAGFITNPIDVVKVRLQLDNELSGKKNIFADRYYQGVVRGLKVIFRDEGLRGFYKGVVASMLREGIYSTIRLGAYEPVKNTLGATEPCSPLWKKMLAGAITGSIGSVCATPTDLVKIQMQGQGKLKPGDRPRHSSTWSAFVSIYKKGGRRALWRGGGPTVLRAAMVSAFQIPAYDHSKNLFKKQGIMEEGIQLHLVCSVFAGLVVSLVTSPWDVIKTRMMNECTVPHSTYSSLPSSLLKIVRHEGFFGLYKGFVPNWVRTGPHTMITFLMFEQLRKISGLDPV